MKHIYKMKFGVSFILHKKGKRTGVAEEFDDYEFNVIGDEEARDVIQRGLRIVMTLAKSFQNTDDDGTNIPHQWYRPVSARLISVSQGEEVYV